MQPLQSLFLYYLQTDWRLNISYIIFEYMRATYKTTSGPSPPGPKMLSLPYWMLLTLIFTRFHVPFYSLVPSIPLISSSCTSTSILKSSHIHLPPVPPRLGSPVLFLCPLHFSHLITLLISTLLHFKVRQSNLVSTNPFSLTNHIFLLLLVHLF